MGLGGSPRERERSPVLAFGLVLARCRVQVFLALAQAAARGERLQQALVRMPIERSHGEPALQRERFVAAGRQRLHPMLQYLGFGHAETPTLGHQPPGEGRAARHLEAFQELAAPQQRRQRREALRRQRRQAALERLGDFERVDPAVRQVQHHRIALGPHARATRLVQHGAQLAQAPPQFAARVGGEVPEQLAQLRARGGAPGGCQIGEQRADLARRRQRGGRVAAGQRQRSEQMKCQRGAGRPLRCDRDPVFHVNSHARHHADFHRARPKSTGPGSTSPGAQSFTGDTS